MRQTIERCALSVRGLLASVLLASALLLTGNTISAQTLYGSLVGNVTDENKSAIPGAVLTITNKGTNLVKEAVANADGEYNIQNILPGVYEVKVTKQGFKTYIGIDLVISANNIIRNDITMSIGNITESVQVASNATVLQTETSQVKSELSGKEINVMPLNAYRNYQTLINLVPGSTPAMFQNANTDTPERSLATNINGTPNNNNNTRIDGATSVNVWLPHHAAYVAPSESVQEVNISTSNFGAEQGMAGGAAVQVITKSGTNQIHGSAFGYHDNHLFQARNLFQNKFATENGALVEKNKHKNLRTITGGTIGGPIKADKIFYFGSFEGMFERLIRFNTFDVPTLQRRNGDLSGLKDAKGNPLIIYDPLTGNVDGQNRTAFTGNKIEPGRISDLAKKALQFVPLPNLPGDTQNYYASSPQTMDRFNYDVKLNWNKSSNHQIWLKMSHMDADVTGQYSLGKAGGACLCDGGSGTGDTSSWIGTIGQTWTLGNTLLLDGNFSVANRGQSVLPPDYGQNIGLDVLGIPGTNDPKDLRHSGFPQLQYGYTALGNQNGWSPLFRAERSYTGALNITKSMRSHDFRVGVDIVKHELNHWQPEVGIGPRGQLNFAAALTANYLGKDATGKDLGSTPVSSVYNSFAAFLLGATNSVEKSIQYEEMTTREWQTGMYIQDNWKATRNLTLNLGLRYELYPMMHRKDRGIEVLNMDSPVRADGGMEVLIGGRGSNENSLDVTTSKKLFAPRLGFAYRLGDNTVIRSGYGITYDPLPLGRPLRGFYPLTIAQTFITTLPGSSTTYTPYNLAVSGLGVKSLSQIAIPGFTGPSLDSGVTILPKTVTMRSPIKADLNRGYIQSWNFTIERKVISDINLSVGYVGTQVTHQFADRQINAAEPGGKQPLNTIYGRTASTLLWDGFLSANYHSMQVALNRRYSSGLFLKGAYTWSKAINMTDETGWVGLTFNSPSQIGRNRALAGYDIPHNFQFATVYELPFGKGKKYLSDGLVGKVFGDWQISGYFSALSGRPLTVSADGATLQAVLAGTQTPDQIKELNKLGGIGAGNPYYDKSSFAAVSGTPRFGTVGRNTLRLPSYANLDLSLVRVFRVKEGVTLDFRVDSFNFTNTPHFGLANMIAANRSINGPNPLQITSAQPDQRQFRFGLRLGF